MSKKLSLMSGLIRRSRALLKEGPLTVFDRNTTVEAATRVRRRARRAALLAALLLAFASIASAPLTLDSLKVGSRVYRHLTIIGANTTDLYFRCDQGLANVKLRALSPEMQRRFDYDPAAAAEAERKQIEDDAAFRDSIVSNVVAKAEKEAIEKQHAAATSENNFADAIFEVSPLGKPAPALEVEKWLGKPPATEGRVLLVYFWAPWSLPCRQYIPELNALQKKFPEKLVVAAVTAESENDVTALADPKIEFASGIDSAAKLMSELGVTSVPTVLLVDDKGNVRYLGHPDALTDKRMQVLLPKPAE
jgi:thiol-disulfide isomerase/thioredoxin